MVSSYRLCVKLLQEINTFCGMRTETDNIAKEHDFIHCSCIRKNGFEGWQVRMDICNPKTFHSYLPSQRAVLSIVDRTFSI